MDERTWLACSNPEEMLDFLGGKVSDRKHRLVAAACCRRVFHLLPSNQEHSLVEQVEQCAEGHLSSKHLDATTINILRMECERVSFSAASKAVLAAGGLPSECVVGWLPSGYDLWPRIDPADERLKLPVAVRLAMKHAALALAEEGDSFGFEEAQEAALSDPAVNWDNDEEILDAAMRLALTSLWVRLYEEERQQQAVLLRDLFGNPVRPLRQRSFPAHVVGLGRSCNGAFPAVSPDFAILADALEELGEEQAAAHCRERLHVKGCHVLDWVLRKE